MTFEDLKKAGILRELARVFDTQERAFTLLERIDYRGERPNFHDASYYWTFVAREISYGAQVEGAATGNGLRELVYAAFDLYQGNPTFRAATGGTSGLREPHQSMLTAQRLPEGQWRNGCSIYFSGSVSREEMVAEINRLAQTMGCHASVALSFDTGIMAAVNLTELTVEQGNTIRQAILGGRLRDSGLQSLDVFANDKRDAIISQLLASGPDGQRFELIDVPASTPAREIGQAVMGQYQAAFNPRDKAGIPRQAVVDHVRPDGTSARLSPDQRLDDAGVQSGDTLNVHPEAMAGAVNPRLREEALARARSQIVSFARACQIPFDVQANSNLTPTEYIVSFEAPSFAPPANPGERPQRIDRQEVLILLPSNFPMVAPLVAWQNPIWHPNIREVDGVVCLGDLMERYKPGLNFGELCQNLIDIASYQNYAFTDGVFNTPAAEWAFSNEGQEQIRLIGGRSALERMFGDLVRSDNAAELKIHRLS